MDGIQVILQALQILPRFIPKPKPPEINYLALKEHLPQVNWPETKVPVIPVQVTPEPAQSYEIHYANEDEEEELTHDYNEAPKEIGTACLSCSRSHLSTVSGSLTEALRFARSDGVRHPEVQRRIMLAEDELNIMERIDLAPDALAQASPEEAKVAREYLPKIRKLRQQIGNISSNNDLEQVASDASVLGQEFRLRHLQVRGVDLNPVLELAKQVQAGEITMAEAKEKLRDYLPDEE